MIRRLIRRALAFVLVFFGCLALILAGGAYLWSEGLNRVYVPSLPTIERTPGQPAPARPGPGNPIGILEIPRLGMQSLVVEGDDTAALLLGVGHLSDTPLPWDGGNSVLAAHRDTFFRPLAGIRENDVIKFVTNDAEIEYVVRETKIVKSSAVEVLAPTSAATLTLITCYPFNFIGQAPDRLVVRAERRADAQPLQLQTNADLPDEPR